MPLQLGVKPITVRVTLEDRDGNQSSVEINLPSTVTILDLIAQVGLIESSIAVLSNANIVGGSINIALTQSTAPSVPNEASDVERKGVFVFDTSNPASFAKLEIPSIDNQFVIDGTDQLNVLGAPGNSLALYLINGFPTLPAAVNGVGFDIVRLRSAYKRHRGSRRG